MTQPRLKLLLGKFPVSRITRTASGFTMLITLDPSRDIKMTVDVPAFADVREGDLLTLYTEIYSNAH